jgi:hypothetical protein
MSERSIYLRDQAAKCRAHANSMTDAETQTALRKLADKYVTQAVVIEASEPELIDELEGKLRSEKEAPRGQA